MFYKENNSRNFCIFNRYRTSFKLDSLDNDTIKLLKERYYENGEDDIIDAIERSKWEEEEERLKNALNINKPDQGKNDS